MSVIGTGIASGVAQSAHAAQQAARERDKEHTDRAQDEVRLSKLFAERLAAAEDAADPDGELPDRQAPGYEQLYEHRLQRPEPEATDEEARAAGVDDFGMPTFHHIDIKA